MSLARALGGQDEGPESRGLSSILGFLRMFEMLQTQIFSQT